MEYLTFITAFVTFVLGLIAKKVSWFKNNLIPLQNLIIGLVVAIIEWIITKDFSIAITTSGLLAGGIYDLGKNLAKIFLKED